MGICQNRRWEKDSKKFKKDKEKVDVDQVFLMVFKGRDILLRMHI